MGKRENVSSLHDARLLLLKQCHCQRFSQTAVRRRRQGRTRVLKNCTSKSWPSMILMKPWHSSSHYHQLAHALQTTPQSCVSILTSSKGLLALARNTEAPNLGWHSQLIAPNGTLGTLWETCQVAKRRHVMLIPCTNWQASGSQHERQLVCCSALVYQMKMYRFVFSSVHVQPRLESILYCTACIDLTYQISLFRLYFEGIVNLHM